MLDFDLQMVGDFAHPRNVGEIENADGIGEVGNAKCGDIMKMYLKIDKGIITDVKFKTFGCGAAVATSSMATELIKGKPIGEALKLTNSAVIEALDGLPPAKIHCSVLGDKALRAAIDDYLARNNLPALKGLEKVEVICNCLNVTDRDIEDAYKKGDRTWEDLQARTKIGTACGGCKERTLELLHQLEHLYGE